jgi:hypothetical protein
MKLTRQQRRVLSNLVDGLPASVHLRTQSEYGGHTKVMWALRRRGLVTDAGSITKAGREALTTPLPG